METNYLLTSFKAAGAQVDTCTLCGAVINRDYSQAHQRVHQADHLPFAVDASGAEVDTCKLCGTLINRSYRTAHDRVHA